MASYTITKIKAGSTAYDIKDEKAFHSKTDATVHKITFGTAKTFNQYTLTGIKAATAAPAYIPSASASSAVKAATFAIGTTSATNDTLVITSNATTVISTATIGAAITPTSTNSGKPITVGTSASAQSIASSSVSNTEEFVTGLGV